MAFKAILGILVILLSGTAFAAAGPCLPWPGQNQGVACGVQAPAQAGPIQGIMVQPQQQPYPPQQQNDLQNQQTMQMMQQALSQMGGGKNGGKYPFYDEAGGADLAYGKSEYGWKNQAATDGKVEKCFMAPPRVLSALEEAKKFRESCGEAQRGENQRIVINDFSSTGHDDIPYMYIFDLFGKCLGKTAVTYGNGLGASVPEACSDNGRHLTPPGFHLTGYHDSLSYPSGTSLGLLSLEGQGSGGRGILIHPAARPGTASSFGCAGVGDFDRVKEALGEGALVYNYFGDKGAWKGCQSQAGVKHDRGCHLETPQRSMPENATGYGDPTSTK
jgi:hypothetical protein